MIQLTPDESRVLGVLIEKALTTPDQYPLSLNAIVNGCNQKNNRDPVLSMDEDATLDALESLRGNGLVVRVDSPGSRVHKYRHNAGDALHARTAELAILAELLLRGPQTLGELRGRASRMQSLESLEVVKGMLAALEQREEPLVRELPRSPGSRAEQYAQLLCPELHPAPTVAALASAEAPIAPASPGLADRVASLESEVVTLKDAIRKLAAALGEGDPLSPE
jgi:uncharacterized protein YceH (UPF0502 family)